MFDGSELYRGWGAVHWALIDFSKPGRDFEFFRGCVKEGNGSALEIGCGTGRVLLPLLAEGFDVEGVDISEEMLASCRRRAAARGIAPVLHCQAMQQLDLPKRYATVYIPCGTFVLVVDRREALDVLRRVRGHLAAGGSLVFNLFLPWTDLPQYPLPEDPPWDLRGDHQIGHLQGERIVIHRRPVHIDPAAQVLTEQRRYRLYHDSKLVSEEIKLGQETWYSPSEIRLMLEVAGFSRIAISGDYTRDRLSEAHREIMVIQGWS